MAVLAERAAARAATAVPVAWRVAAVAGDRAAKAAGTRAEKVGVVNRVVAEEETAQEAMAVVMTAEKGEARVVAEMAAAMAAAMAADARVAAARVVARVVAETEAEMEEAAL